MIGVLLSPRNQDGGIKIKLEAFGGLFGTVLVQEPIGYTVVLLFYSIIYSHKSFTPFGI